ncbi:MAG: GAF domain-containing protein [Anaerolineae bacterium]|nr:GAF domain-containing protein [Anaerolineae bacterium]
MNTIKNWFKPPTFDDPDKTRVAELLNAVLITIILLLGAYLTIQLASRSVGISANSTIVLSILLVIAIGLKAILSRGQVRTISHILIASAWIALVMVSWGANGLKDIGFTALIIVILLAGLLEGWKAGALVTFFTIGVGWFFAYAEANELLKTRFDDPFNLAVDTTLVFLIIAILLTLIINSLSRALKNARESEQSLAASNQELQTIQEQLEDRVTEQTRDLTLASELGRDISQIRDLDELLTTAVERIRSRFDLYYTQIYLVNEDAENTTLKLSAGTGIVAESLIKRGHQLNIDTRSINGRAALEKKPVIVADTAQSPIFQPNPSLPYTRSEMAIPLLVGNKVLGVLDLQSQTAGGLNEDNLSAFEVLAGQLAITLQNAALFKEQERLTQELQANTKQVQENAAFLDTVLENLPTRLFVKDAKDLRYLRWNKAGAELLGIPTEEVIGKTDLDIYPDMAHIYMNADRATLEKGVLFDVPEEIAPTPHGPRVLHTLNVPIFDDEGNPLFLLGISEDITEQKEAERMLNERVKELNLLNEIGQKTDEQPTLEEFLTFIANRIPAGMQHADLCKVAITVHDKVYGDPEAINLPSQIVEGLRLEDEQIGRIYIAYTEKQSFINEESALIGSIGRRVTDYIANRRLLDRVQATVEGLQTVAEVGTAITSQQDTQQLLQNVVDLTKTKFNFYHAHIYLYDEMIDALVLSAGAGEIGRQMVSETRQIPLSAPRSLVARAARERQGLVVANVKADPSFLAHPLLPDTRSEMAVPLVVGKRLIGVMDIQSSEENGFTPEDVNIQTTLASQIAVALQNAEQYEQTQAALDEVNALQRALTREGWQAYMTAVNRPTKGFQIAENEILPILAETSPENGNHENNNIVYPLSVRGTAIGRIGVNTKDKTLSQNDLELLESISDQVAEALERARLFEETETARSQTEALFTGSENVVRATSLHDILKSLVQATALKNMERASLILFNQPWQDTPPESLTVTASWQQDNSAPLVAIGTTFSLDMYPVTQFLQRDAPFVIDDFTTDPRVDENSRRLFVEGMGMRSAITTPLVIGEQWIGFVLGLSSTIYNMNESEKRQIMSLAGQAATVAQSQRLYQDAQARARREQILREVSARVASAVDAEAVLQTATREIGRALGLETFVYLKDPKKNKVQEE